MIVAMIKSTRFDPERIVAMLLLAATVLLQGCAELAVGIVGQVVVPALAAAAYPSTPGDGTVSTAETNRATLGYPAVIAYAALTQTVERNGRKIVEAIPATYTLRISYPFSLWANNWGGVITITLRTAVDPMRTPREPALARV